MVPSNYDGLEDADEFYDPMAYHYDFMASLIQCVGCGSGWGLFDRNYALCTECGSSWCPDCMGDTYDSNNLNIMNCANCENRGLHESYEGLEDADEFDDVVTICSEAVYDLLPKKIQDWNKVDDLILLYCRIGHDPESIAHNIIDTYLEYGYELADTPSGYPEGCELEPPMQESYEGLEDADEFSDPRQYVSCVGCGSEQHMYDCNYALCFECGSSWCPDCMGDTYDNLGYIPDNLDISDCANCENRGLNESYEGLEDADDFSPKTCNCGYARPPATCSECRQPVCPMCSDEVYALVGSNTQPTARKLPWEDPGAKFVGIFCNEKHNNLRTDGRQFCGPAGDTELEWRGQIGISSRKSWSTRPFMQLRQTGDYEEWCAADFG